MTNITWKNVLHYMKLLMPLVVAVAGGTYTLTKLAMDAEISAYRLKFEMQDNRIKELLERLNEKQVRTYSISPPNITRERSPETGALPCIVKIVLQFFAYLKIGATEC